MKIRISSASLANAMQAVSGCVSGRAATAMQGGVLISASDGEVTFRTTDMFTSVKATVQAYVAEQGETVVSAKMLHNISRSLPDADIELATLDDGAQLKCLKSRWKLRTLNPRDFPMWEDMSPDHSVTVNRKTLSELVDRVCRAVAKDNTKPVLKSIHTVVGGGRIVLVATDALRVCSVGAPAEGDEFIANIPSSALKGAMAAKSSAETVTIACSDTQACIVDGAFTYITRLAEGNYPNVDMLMPKSCKTTVTLDPDEFANALKRAGVVASVNPAVILDIAGDTMTIRAVSNDQGESTETIPIESDGEPLTIGFNHHYILDCVDYMDGKVVIKMIDKTNPAVFHDYGDIDMTYLLLPVRV